jgi:hypothetical protein
MDFVEKLFHVSPDGGSGAYEVLIVALVGFLVCAAALLGYFRNRSLRKSRTTKK